MTARSTCSARPSRNRARPRYPLQDLARTSWWLRITCEEGEDKFEEPRDAATNLNERTAENMQMNATRRDGALEVSNRSTEPKSLRHEHVKAQRLSALGDPHVQRLTRFVDELRQRKGQDYAIPYFDPHDGGADAKALFLLEAPGGKAKDSGFVSRDNPDETAKNIWTMSRELGIDRRDSIIWNVCPWYVGTPSKIRAVRASEVLEAAEALRWLLGHLERLKCVALVGRKAQLARTTVANTRPDVRIVEMPHPSPMFVNRAPGNRLVLRGGFEAVQRALIEG